MCVTTNETYTEKCLILKKKTISILYIYIYIHICMNKKREREEREREREIVYLGNRQLDLLSIVPVYAWALLAMDKGKGTASAYRRRALVLRGVTKKLKIPF